VAVVAVRSGDDPFAAVHNFFHSTAWHLFSNLSMAIALAFWVASVWWVFSDARRRIEDPWLVATATVLGVLPPLGPMLYLLLRPAESLADTRERKAIQGLRQLLSRVEFCHECGAESDASFHLCPVCATELRRACPQCEELLKPIWQACPFCGTHSAADPSTGGELPSFPDLTPVPAAMQASESAAL